MAKLFTVVKDYWYAVGAFLWILVKFGKKVLDFIQYIRTVETVNRPVGPRTTPVGTPDNKGWEQQPIQHGGTKQAEDLPQNVEDTIGTVVNAGGTGTSTETTSEGTELADSEPTDDFIKKLKQ